MNRIIETKFSTRINLALTDLVDIVRNYFVVSACCDATFNPLETERNYNILKENNNNNKEKKNPDCSIVAFFFFFLSVYIYNVL